MAFDWKEYLDLARFLQGKSEVRYSQEAAFRSAVSRAYYAAYCYARNYAHDQHGFMPSKGSQDHTLVREHFRKRGYIDIANDLDDLRQLRNNCDYDDTIMGDFNQLVQSAIMNTEDVFAKLKS